jgi:hypothetical protein
MEEKRGLMGRNRSFEQWHGLRVVDWNLSFQDRNNGYGKHRAVEVLSSGTHWLKSLPELHYGLLWRGLRKLVKPNVVAFEGYLLVYFIYPHLEVTFGRYVPNFTFCIFYELLPADKLGVHSYSYEQYYKNAT